MTSRLWLRSAGLEVRVVRIVLVAIAVMAVALLIWQLTDVLVLLFAAVLIATGQLVRTDRRVHADP
jgi:hypothetical protein